jgi:hypothetical protein
MIARLVAVVVVWTLPDGSIRMGDAILAMPEVGAQQGPLPVGSLPSQVNNEGDSHVGFDMLPSPSCMRDE